MLVRDSLVLAVISSAMFGACYDDPKTLADVDQEAAESEAAKSTASSPTSDEPGKPPRPRDKDGGAAPPTSDAGPNAPDAPPPPPAPFVPSFTQVYDDVIAKTCVQYCHDSSHGTGLAMGNRGQAYQNLVGVHAGVGGSADDCQDGVRTRVVPGSASSSLMIHKVRATQDCGEPMPPKGALLTAAQIAVIEDWINGGAADD